MTGHTGLPPSRRCPIANSAAVRGTIAVPPSPLMGEGWGGGEVSTSRSSPERAAASPSPNRAPPQRRVFTEGPP